MTFISNNNAAASLQLPVTLPPRVDACEWLRLVASAVGADASGCTGEGNRRRSCVRSLRSLSARRFLGR